MILFSVAALSARPVFAHEADKKYEFIVSTGTLAKLLQGPNLVQFMRKKMPFVLKTEKEITELNMSSAASAGLLFGRYPSSRGMVDLELLAEVAKQQVEITYTPSQVDAIVYEWEETYSAPAALKGLNPSVSKLKFHQGEGLHYDALLKKKFGYLLSVDISYDENARKLADIMPELAEVKKFINAVEGDLHGRTIVENNRSGTPPLVFFEKLTDGSDNIRLHHPMHDVLYDRKTKQFSYLYSDEIALVAKLPEVKRMLAVPEVKKFVLEKPESIQVRMEGSPTKGFIGVITRMESGGQIKVKMDRKKVTLL